MNTSNNIITHIVSDYNYDYAMDYDGKYSFAKDGDTIYIDDVPYVYHMSGLCRCVYVDPNKEWVIKTAYSNVDNSQIYKEMLKAITTNSSETYFIPVEIKHNMYEYDAYNECPEEYKKYLAHTELLPNGWVKQEFVDVKKLTKSSQHNLREIGINKLGNYVIFDYDPFLERFERPETFNYDWLPRFIARVPNLL